MLTKDRNHLTFKTLRVVASIHFSSSSTSPHYYSLGIDSLCGVPRKVFKLVIDFMFGFLVFYSDQFMQE